MTDRTYFVYILANRSRTLYVGVTNDLHRRVAEHKQGRLPGFTARYRINRLVFAESMSNVVDALRREKQIKGWSRLKKITLIETINPTWKDLAVEWGVGGETADPSLTLGTTKSSAQDDERCSG